MKFGETLQRNSGQKWAPYGVDYNDLKNIIKEYAKQEEVQAIAIPGQINEALKEFEELFFNELYIQHDRVDLFVKSTCYEIDRRLQIYNKQVIQLFKQSECTNGQPMARLRQENLAKFARQITRCGEEILSLQRFVDDQRTAFQKLLKKSQKWTGSKAIEERFRSVVLNSTKSFTKRDFDLSLFRQQNLLTAVRQLIPDSSTPRLAPRSVASLRSSSQIQVQHEPQFYWNEYDNGNEVEGNEPYTILVKPDESRFLGAKRVVNLLAALMEKIKGWRCPMPSPGERRHLLENRALLPNGNSNLGYITEQTETDMEDNAHASSTDIPSAGYATYYYSTFPSVVSQKYSRYREKLLFRGMIGSFATAFILSCLASLLLATGKKKLSMDVDAGVIVIIFASLLFIALALGSTLCTTEPLSWLRRGCVGATFITLCIVNVMLLVMVVVVVGKNGLQ